MKLNKTMVALIAGGLLAGGALQAQDSPNGKPPAVSETPVAPAAPGTAAPVTRARPVMTLEKISKELGLTDEQTKKLKEAREERAKQLTDLRADTSIPQTDKRTKLKEINEATNAKIKAFLTPDQYEKYTKLTPGPRNRPAMAAPGAPAPAKPAADATKQQ